MKNILIYILLAVSLAACQTEIKGPEEAMIPSVPEDSFTFSPFAHPEFKQKLDKTFDIYTVVNTSHEFRFGPHDTEYGKYDVIALVENSRFDYYVRLFTGNYRKVFQKWLDRSNEYVYILRDILRREGVPEELVYLPFTESGFNPAIRSRAGACGMWQFMKGTGKAYGLDTDFWVDERNDFEKSTVAAARHLKDLYESLGDWYLAMAAYNAGLGKVLNAIKRYNTRDYFVMSQRKYRYLKLETKDYVPKYMALRYLARNYQEYGFDTPNGQPQLFDRVTLYRQANLYVLAKIIGSDIDTLRELNPELMTPMTPPVEEYSMRIPYGKKKILEEKLEHISDAELAQFHIEFARKGHSIASYAKKYGMTASALKDINGLRHNMILRDTYLFIPIKNAYDEELNRMFVQELKRYNPKVHIVRSGDNMYQIAHKYGMSLYELMAMNRDVNPKRIRPGQSIIVSDSYYNTRTNKKSVRTYASKTKSGSYAKITHKVSYGESLWSIANQYGTTISQIKSSNKLRSNVIQPGKDLIVYNYNSSAADDGKYTVRRGDSLWEIARKFNTSVNTIKRKNNLRGNNIHPGSVLVVD
ncbi:Lytic transglycosylase catalytic [Denitrovibrio acetiphilus DSM 12809]|uniref:Lytic transglycosylase catalytic n=1 Tax=Denitrovibrio acetiphilus (strain DSM 12809 / NBRC 114555 / N2460) TaxID=522772 RepID=D4H3R6_DENA2|nr:LysM peptidoglycan-binding domain-containing protein [Denitrovibrio acetiphilus]ADD69168.1 Lytic transglycosylase catalytic [Denitrovibrio acetiphilus DSM 12809]